MSEKSIEGSFKMFELPHPNLLDIMKEAYPCAKFYEQQESVPNFKTEIVNCQVCKEADWNPAKGFMPRSYIGATGKLEEVEAILVCINPFEPHRAVEPHRGEEYDPEHSSLEMVEANVRYVHDCIRGLQPRFKSRFHIRMKEFLDKLYPNEHLNQILKKVWITQCRLCSSNSDSTDIDSVSCMDLYLKKQLEISYDGFQPSTAIFFAFSNNFLNFSPFSWFKSPIETELLPILSIFCDNILFLSNVTSNLRCRLFTRVKINLTQRKFEQVLFCEDNACWIVIRIF